MSKYEIWKADSMAEEAQLILVKTYEIPDKKVLSFVTSWKNGATEFTCHRPLLS